LTSNIGSQYITEYSSDGYEKVRNTVMGELRKFFRPEFLNRVDEIVVFHSLSLEHIRGIVKIQISRFKERLTANGIGLQIDEAAEDLLAEKGYDPVYGARPIKRVIQKELETQSPVSLSPGK
jgi:ATP-dependent Clp protease ATP-binding subunit ClpB